MKQILRGADTPRAVAITADGRFAYVTHFLTRGVAGAVTEIDLTTLAVSRAVPLVVDASPDTTSSGGGFPNMLSAIAIDPAGRAAWFGGLKANTGRGLFVNGETPRPENTTRGFFGKVNLASATEELARRIDANDTDSVSAIAFSPNGRWAFVTHQGAGRLSVYDLSAATLIQPGDGNTVSFVARIDLGHAPQGIVVSADGRRGYVANYLSRDVQVLDLSNPRTPVVLATVPTTTEPLPPAVANGKRLFYRSREPRHSFANYIACASCHADGSGHAPPLRRWPCPPRSPRGAPRQVLFVGAELKPHGREIVDFKKSIALPARIALHTRSARQLCRRDTMSGFLGTEVLVDGTSVDRGTYRLRLISVTAEPIARVEKSSSNSARAPGALPVAGVRHHWPGGIRMPGCVPL